MAGLLQDKVAIVTGAAQGIGQVYAETFAREGAKVVLADRKAEQVQANARAIQQAGGQALAEVTDIADQEAVQGLCRQTADQFGGIDILVNNAEIYEGYVHYTLDEVPLDYWNRFLDVNATSVLLTTQAVVPYFRRRGKGTIVN